MMVDKSAEARREASASAGDDEFLLPRLNGDHLSPSYLATLSSVPLPVLLAETPEEFQEHHNCTLHQLFDHFVIEILKGRMAYNRKTNWLITFLVSGAAAVDSNKQLSIYRMSSHDGFS